MITISAWRSAAPEGAIGTRRWLGAGAISSGASNSATSNINGAAGTGFKTPLATLHAFNGWADKFLGTPDAGLTDLYLKASATLPAGFTAAAQYHLFGTANGATDIGSEIDLQLTYKYDTRLSFTAKVASYAAAEKLPVAGSTAAHQDTDKFWLQADYTF